MQLLGMSCILIRNGVPLFVTIYVGCGSRSQPHLRSLTQLLHWTAGAIFGFIMGDIGKALSKELVFMLAFNDAMISWCARDILTWKYCARNSSCGRVCPGPIWELWLPWLQTCLPFPCWRRCPHVSMSWEDFISTVALRWYGLPFVFA